MLVHLGLHRIQVQTGAVKVLAQSGVLGLQLVDVRALLCDLRFLLLHLRLNIIIVIEESIALVLLGLLFLGRGCWCRRQSFLCNGACTQRVGFIRLLLALCLRLLLALFAQASGVVESLFSPLLRVLEFALQLVPLFDRISVLARNALQLLHDHLTLQAALIQELDQGSRIADIGERRVLSQGRFESFGLRYARVCGAIVTQEFCRKGVL